MSASLTRFTARAALLAAIVSSAAFTTAFGPPHISVRKVSTADTAPAGAVLLVEGGHHDKDAELNIIGRAEGLQNGKRISQPLRLEKQSAGHYSLSKQWQDGTPWILVLAVDQGSAGAHGVAEALVKVDASGTIGAIEYPAPGWIGRTNTPKRTASTVIDAMLAQMVARR
ncbi:MAG: hypothetical protein V4813_05220 [Gemmatimonadota bacterium]